VVGGWRLNYFSAPVGIEVINPVSTTGFTISAITFITMYTMYIIAKANV
jgi:hypothetical protein